VTATFGVSSTFCQRHVPNVTVDDEAAVTSTSLGEMILMSAGVVGGKLRHMGLDPDVVQADSSTDLYLVCQDLVFRGVEIRMLRAAHGSDVLDTRLREWERSLDERLTSYVVSPGEMGEVGASIVVPRTMTSALGLNTDDESRRKRRMYDGSRYRTSGTDDIFRN